MLRKIYMIGMGALGVLFGDQIRRNLPAECSLHFIADRDRIARYGSRPTSCNGKLCCFEFADSLQQGETADLLIFATKTTGLVSAMESAKNYVGKDTVLLCVSNGISSEKLLAQRFGGENVIKCIARGMDAVKLGDDLAYHTMGELVFGASEDEPRKQATVSLLHDFFEKTKVPHLVSEEIDRIMWAKFMINVGLNQSMMVYETNYGGMQHRGVPRDTMIAAMREVIELSRYENICLTEDDLASGLALLDTLNPEGLTSMRQDSINRRPSEVESFSGTVLRLAEKHGLAVPANRFLHDKILEMESAYAK